MHRIFRQKQAPERDTLLHRANWERLRDLQTGIRDRPLPQPPAPRKHCLSACDSTSPQYAADDGTLTLWSLPLEIRTEIYTYVLSDNDIHLYLTTYERTPRSLSRATSSVTPRKRAEATSASLVRSSKLPHPELQTEQAPFWSVSHCLADPRLPRPRDPLRAWPRFKNLRMKGILDVLCTCRRFYAEIHPLLYKLQTFYITDPTSFIVFPRLLPSELLAYIRQLHIFWFLPGKLPPQHLEHRLRKTWREFWATLKALYGLRVVSVRLLCDFGKLSDRVGGRTAEEHETSREAARDLSEGGLAEDDVQWLEIVRQVTAPEVFQLAIPIDWPDLDFDFRPSKCRLVKHDPTLAVPR